MTYDTLYAKPITLGLRLRSVLAYNMTDQSSQDTKTKPLVLSQQLFKQTIDQDTKIYLSHAIAFESESIKNDNPLVNPLVLFIY